jgi:uncharacterized damage-inducible protein DinB
MKEIIEKLVEYNKLTNNDMFTILSTINNNDLNKDIGSYFISINGILNHLINTDIIWLQRIKRYFKAYTSLDNELINTTEIKSITQINTNNFHELRNTISNLDQIFINLLIEIKNNELGKEINYLNTKGERKSKMFWLLLVHIFNHNTHHRGQISGFLDIMKIENDFSNMIYKI